MNTWLIVVLCIILTSFTLELVVSYLNIGALSPDLPKEFEDVYNRDEYEKSQQYTKTTTRFGIFENSISTVLTVGFLILGGFNWIDTLARSFGYNAIVTGLLFTAGLGLLSFLVGTPFSIYSTFVIEEKFGFNKTTAKTFILDLIKGILRFARPPSFDIVAGREIGYAYFQDFIPENQFDIRVVVIGKRSFAIKRMVRKDDFRASGSGKIKYGKDNFDNEIVVFPILRLLYFGRYMATISFEYYVKLNSD